ncbi:MAG TPA: GNAT family N-acetyltransferase [Solirubrobacterales bacterium]|nr:GNAT family N-acetyltransferase [Solirubrobacterales bacterium]
MSPQSPASTIGAHRAGRGIAARGGGELRIRRTLEPGDIGAIAAQHGRLYGREFGLDVSFEADLARALYAAAKRGWPTDREGAWIVERAGALAGSLALTDEGDRTGRVRAFLLDPALRGRGLGRHLLGELLDRARAAGYARLVLETFSELRAAARLYTERGFVLVWSRTGPRWGMERMTYQRYELDPLEL